jgi:DNA helicase-2/ATP-dependent DNA helicase PcrA
VSSVVIEREYNRGDRVFHDKFGTGTIVNIEGSKLDIQFDKAGHKRVLDSFIVKA